ncbi:hypothetical protein DEJ28_17360 [Curtobacterium sp. MCPF17_002]|uniref:hypothetical protein n=1 Tax=Curtobacterium sp. MCPF17_002 TaxID=2175645 RepID=UPI0011B77163|nr:hypothetical protein [Curtobacterium sp. MCPF17_002]WIB77388.1 hypothetical protein DEJ28_17360 [Curtobacterium sp. MCPF17_002]
MRPAGRRQGTVRSGLEARRRIHHRLGTTSGAGPRRPARTPQILLEFLVFDVFVVAGVLAVFGVVALIAKGVERL